MNPGSAEPVFLLSTERSGSNLARSILNTHSEITAPHPFEPTYPWRKTKPPGEMSQKDRGRLVRDILVNKHYSFQPLVDAVDVKRVHQRLEALDPETFLDVQQALYEEYANVVDASLWVSKDPGEWEYIEQAFDHYSDLKIIYLIRDPRDVALSFKTSNVGRYHPYFSARRWGEEQSQALDILDQYPDAIHRIRYEELLQNPESVARGMCEFLSIEYEPKMLYYYDTEDAQKASQSSEAFENLSVPIKSDNYDKYKDRLPREEIRITEKLTANELVAHGYDLEHGESELEAFELSPEDYEATDRKLQRHASLDDWLENPREQVARYTTRSFSYYMMLRYGLFQ